jgi:uncharacterized protein (TIGR00251 family)
MEILETVDGVVLNIYIKPGSTHFKIKIDDGKLFFWCHEHPLKGKVNKELLNKFSRIFGQRVELISGYTSKHKKILINNINSEKVFKILNSI